MSIFCFKKLSPPVRLGERLRRAREAADFNLAQAAANCNVPEKYLAALESNRFTELPKAKVYRLSYLSEYARLLKLKEKPLFIQFIKEGGLKDLPEVSPEPSAKQPRISWPLLARNLFLAAGVLLLLGYLGWQVRNVLQPPRLEIFFPPEGYVTNKANITLEGETEKECRLTVNGGEITVNDQGRFQPTIDLTNGVNTIIITATKKHGKTATITRHVVVKNTK